MRRREFIAMIGGGGAWPLAARAQQAMPVVGYLSVGAPVAEHMAALRKGLSEQGYLEGRNFVFEPRITADYDWLPPLAAELVARRVAVIFIFSNSNAVQAAKLATATIPIVFTMGADPVLQGVVASLDRPGSNITGVTFSASEMEPKRLEALVEVVPRATTIAFLANPAQANTGLNIQNIQSAARKAGRRIIVVNASTAAEIDDAFATLVREQVGGLSVEGDAFFVARRSQIIVLAARHAIPAVYFDPEFTRAGGLMSYSDDRAESYRLAGLYVGRVLKGEKAGDLPVLQPTKFEFVVNLSTAKAIGIEVPATLLVRADEVIE